MIDSLLARLADDWVSAAEVTWVAKSVGGASTNDETCNASLSLIRHLLDRGMTEVGDITDGGFFAWDLTSAESVERIQREWGRIGRPPRIGEIGWFAITGHNQHGSSRASAPSI